MSGRLRILIAGESEADAAAILGEIRRNGFTPDWERVDTAIALTTALGRRQWDVIVAGFDLPGLSGIEALTHVRAHDMDVPFIFISAGSGEDIAIHALKAGANECIVQNDLRRLVPAIERELQRLQARREDRRMTARLQYLAYYDPLTNLPNRALLCDRMRQALALAQRTRKSLAFMILDLDGFKEVNDTLGHRTGDALLRQVGHRVQEVLRKTDTISRVGGDEFAVLIAGADAETVTLVAQRVLAVVDQPFLVEQTALNVRASLGVALYPEHGDTLDLLMQRADIAMYSAKERQCGAAVYAPHLDRQGTRRRALGGELKHALEQGDVRWHYQPKVRLRDGGVLGFELLARWQHPAEGVIPAEQFIALAEEHGLMGPLTHLAIDTALKTCSERRSDSQRPTCSVNLSPTAIFEEGFPAKISKQLEESGLAGSCLECEITENLIIADPDRASSVLAELHEIGVRLSIDDFGTGYSSLGLLRTLPIHEIKIDESFIRDLGRRGDELIVRSTIDLAHNLGLTVVAEGVETLATWDRLVALGCDAAQGYFISPPVAHGDLSGWTRTWIDRWCRTPTGNSPACPLPTSA